MSTNPSAYHRVEFAFGGPDKRGQFADMHTLRVGPKVTDAYTSVYRFTEELREYAEANRRTGGKPDPNGKPSVAGYAGSCLPIAVHYDLDHTDPEVSLADARCIILRLVDEYDVPPEALSIHFTGQKGFTLEAPASLFGGFEPSADAPARIKRLALALIAGLPVSTFDASVYDKTRLWRVPGTRHGKTGLLKTRITVDELLTLTLDEIKALAAAPRTVAVVPDDEWLPRPELVALWQETDRPEETITASAPPDPRGAAPELAQRLAAAVLAEVWPDAGGRHTASLALQGGLARAGLPEDMIAAFTADVTARAMGSEADTRADEWRRGAATTIARVKAGKPVIGWPTLAAMIGEEAVNAVRNILGIIPPPAPIVVFPSEAPAGGCPDCPRLKAENDELRGVTRGMIKVLYSTASAPAKVAQILLAVEAHTARKGSLLSHEGLSKRAHISTDVLDKARDARIGADGVFTKRLVSYKASPYTGEVHSPPVNYQVIEPRSERLSDTLFDCAENIPDVLLPPVRTGQKSKKAAPKPDMPFTDSEVPLCTEDPNASITVNVEPLYVARCEDCGEPLAAKTGDGAVLTSPIPFGAEQGDAAAEGADTHTPPRVSLSLNSVRNGTGKRHTRNWGNPPEGWNVCAFPNCGKHTRSDVCTDCAERRLGDWGTRADESRAWAEASS